MYTQASLLRLEGLLLAKNIEADEARENLKLVKATFQ